METDSTRMCLLLVGLVDVVVTGVGNWPRWLRIAVESILERPDCAVCSARPHAHGHRDVELVDPSVFGRPARLVWRKPRWRCPGVRVALDR